MSTDPLSTALRDLVADAERGVVAPDVQDLWAAGRRRRVTGVAFPLLAAACLIALIALVAWPAGVPRAAVPAVQVDDREPARLTAFPAAIAKPPFVTATRSPGVTAALVPSAGADQRPYAVSPRGEVSRVDLPPAGAGSPELQPSLSPDGRWVARGVVLTDLVRGVTTPSPSEQARVVGADGPPLEPGWWSPDSRRVFVATLDAAVESDGVVVTTDGEIEEVPAVERGIEATFAGWLDGDTLLALLDLGPGTSRLEVRTWTIGDPSWIATGAVMSWSQSEPTELRALVSPEGQRLLLTAAGVDDATNELATTRAMMFDPRSGARLGMPLADGTVRVSDWAEDSYAGWDGWGCRPAWHDGLPVITDRGVKGLVDGTGGRGELVGISSRYGSPCVAFAGNELRGRPVTNHVLVWKERLWAWGLPLLGLCLIGLALWAWQRRHRDSWRQPPKRRPMIITQPF